MSILTKILNNNTKYKVSYSNVLGRYLVADKNICAGEIILEEKPIVVGPTNMEKFNLCFSCMKSIFSIQYICSKCKVAPLCSHFCEQSQGFHSNEECELLKKNKKSFGDDVLHISSVLLCLRLWLLNKNNPKLWEEINKMEAHIEKRRGSHVWENIEKNIINYFHRFKFINDNKEESSELIQQICGILDVNTFELRSPNNINQCFVRGLYKEASLMAHNCIGNTYLMVDHEFHLIVYACIPIQKDDIIFCNYTSSLLGFAERRAHLMQGKYFFCDCSLCKDPSEGGSNISAMLCSKCKKGHVLIQNTLENNPYAKSTKWQCQLCEHIYSGCLIKSTLNIAETLINETKEDDIEEMEALLQKLLKSLHTNNFLILILKQKLLAAYRKKITLNSTENIHLQKQLDLCKEVMTVIEIMEPGISRLKGILAYEMHYSMVMLANRTYTLRQISSEELISKLEEGKDLLKLSLTMLLLEAATTPEGLLAKQAFQELKTLTQNINDIKCLPS